MFWVYSKSTKSIGIKLELGFYGEKFKFDRSRKLTLRNKQIFFAFCFSVHSTKIVSPYTAYDKID